MQRREFIAVIGGAVAAWPLAARAQKSLPRIGWLVFGDAKLGPVDQSLKDALAQAGLIDGRNVEIVIIFDTTDTKKAKEFATSSDLKNVMTKAGVIDVPTMYFLESI